MPFVKLDKGILTSTIWCLRPELEVFVTALLMAEPRDFPEPVPTIQVDSLEDGGWIVPPGWYGFVPAAGPGIVRAAHVAPAPGMEALKKLASPEPESRSQEFGGRRMVRVNGGYIVLNFMKYRDFDHSAADRMRKLRERRKRNVTANSDGVTRNSDENGGDVTVLRRNVTHSREQRQIEEAENTNTPIADGSANGGGQEAPKGGVRKAPRGRDPLFDALAEADGSNPQQLTRSAARAIGVALAEIRRACPDLTPDEITRRMGHYRLLMPNVRPTATGLAKHWARCDTEPESIEQKGFGFAR